MTARVLALDRGGRGEGASHASDLDLGALVLTILTVLEVRRQGMAARAHA